jgi:NNP family nitrate/nitrite transporter-like MFS transporter
MGDPSASSVPEVKNMNENPEDSKKGKAAPASFRFQVGPLLYLVGTFFLNFLSRIVLSPLMPTIEEDLKLGHDEAGSLFFLISLGFCMMLLGSGFVSSRLNHRRTIILSSMAVGMALLFVGLTHSLWGVRIGLLILGMAAGLYLPSGIAIITELVDPKHWGKAIAIHELAPNLGCMIAPLLAEVLLGWFSWRGVVIMLGIVSMLAAVVFAFLGKGGTFLGEAPNSRILRNILVDPSFWVMIALFTLGIGASFGVYSMIPLYLVSERGMGRPWANILIGLSRISPLATAILSGWFTDRFGPKQTLKGVFLATGLITGLLGIVPGSWIILIVFLQPMISTSFFPPGFAALSRIGSTSIQKVAVSLTVPIGFLLGGGAIPAGIGLIGAIGSFSLGFTILGGLILGGFILIRYLKFR